jgi:hypothetical protein
LYFLYRFLLCFLEMKIYMQGFTMFFDDFKKLIRLVRKDEQIFF